MKPHTDPNNINDQSEDTSGDFNEQVRSLMRDKGYSEQEAILIAGCKLAENKNAPVCEKVNQIHEK